MDPAHIDESSADANDKYRVLVTWLLLKEFDESVLNEEDESEDPASDRREEVSCAE